MLEPVVSKVWFMHPKAFVKPRQGVGEIISVLVFEVKRKYCFKHCDILKKLSI